MLFYYTILLFFFYRVLYDFFLIAYEGGIIICEFRFRTVKGTLQIFVTKRGRVALGLMSFENHLCVNRTLNFKKGDMRSHFDPGSANQ